MRVLFSTDMICETLRLPNGKIYLYPSFFGRMVVVLEILTAFSIRLCHSYLIFKLYEMNLKMEMIKARRDTVSEI
jgi:hypothetical protein